MSESTIVSSYHRAMDQHGDDEAESRRLATLLVQRAERAKAAFAEAVEPYGLPTHLARALLLLETPMPQFELAEQLTCDRSYVTGLADGLEERGLVTRSAGSDRRMKILVLTAAGEELRVRLAHEVAEHSPVTRLSPGERALLDRLLARLGED
jgi:DNA-binding MarR family transcriptional regulator